MALLFAQVAEKYTSKAIEKDETLSSKVTDLFDVIDSDGLEAAEEKTGMLPQQMFVTSVANEYYKKSIEDIKNTQVGNKSVRRKNFKQIMNESFFYGANRFGNNFIA